MVRTRIDPNPAVDLPQLPLALVLQINVAADDFEMAWQSGKRPRIEDFLAGTDDRQRAALLHQLIPLDADYRRLRGESPTAEDYQQRFPEFNCGWLTQSLGGNGRRASVPSAPVASSSSTVQQTPTRFGDYELLAEVGRGGMGVVFRARHRRLNRVVALKMILAGRLADEARVRRFYAEASAAARLQHPGIVPVYEVGEHDGQHFLSMGFVVGSDLSALVRRGCVLPVQAATLIKDVAEAVDYAHHQGVIHRDLKPQNILIDKARRPLVTDFGLAKDACDNEPATETGVVLGTPDYMAPEQAEGRPDKIGPAADVYSLGATLYHLLTGRPPFRSASRYETVRHLLEREPAPPRAIAPGIPKDLETICLACLRKDPARRPPSAAALADDLERWLRREPIRARPVSSRERVWLWCRRKPAAAGLVAVLVAVFLATIAVGVEGYRRFRTKVLVEQLLASDTADVPHFTETMTNHSGRVGSLLREAFTAAEARGDERQQLHAALALRVFEQEKVDYLRDRALPLYRRADEFARQGKWKQAALAMDRALALHPNELNWLICSAKLRLYLGDIDGYRQRCRDILERFGRTDLPTIAHKIGHTVLLAPDPVGEPGELVALAKIAARSGSSRGMRSLAVAHYRQGRLAEARKLLRRAATRQSGDYTKAHTFFFLAMTHHRLGEFDQARRRLVEAKQPFDRGAARTATGKYGTLWRHWITLSIVRREAETLIHEAAEPPPTSQW